MSTSQEITPIDLWLLAARLSSSSAATPWTALAVARDQIEDAARDLAEQLGAVLGEAVPVERMRSFDDLDRSVSQNPSTALVLAAVRPFDEGTWRRVDLARSRLTREHPAVLVLAEEELPILLRNAPNFGSWLAGALWRWRRDEESLRP